MAQERLIIEITESGARIVIRDFSRISKEAASASKSVNAMNSALATTAARALTLRNALTAIGVGSLAVGVRNAVGNLAEFDDQMGAVAAVTGATAAELQQMTEVAIEMGQTTRFSATDAAVGMQLLARAGFSASQSMAAVDDVLRLKLVGSMANTETAANIVIAALTGFKIGVEDAARVTDVLAFAANATNTSVEQLGEALKFMTLVAAGLGLTIEETTAAIGILSNAGLGASIAGTGLRRVFAQLESPTRNTARLLSELGLSAESVRVSQVGLIASLQKLRDAGVDTGLALEIFGDRGGPAFLALVKQLPQLQKLTEQMNRVRGESDRIAKVMDDTLKGSLLRVRNALETLIIRFGEGGGIQAFRVVLDAVAATLKFVANNLQLVSGALLGLRFGFPIIGALAGALVQFADQIKFSSDGVVTLESAFLSMLSTAAKVVDSIQGFFTGAVAAIIVTFKGLDDALLNVVIGFVNAAIRLFNDFFLRVQLGLNNLIEVANRVSANVTGGQGLNLGSVALLQISEIKNPVSQAAEELGKTAGDAFQIGFESSTSRQDAVKAFLERLAQDRGRAAAAKALAGGGVGPPKASGLEGLDDELQEAAQAAREAEVMLFNLNKELARQEELLGASAQEREIANEQFRVENQLKQQGIDLGKQENVALIEQINERVRLLEVLEAQNQVAQEILGPQQRAVELQAAANALHERGIINTQQLVDFTRKLRAEVASGTTAWEGFTDALEKVDVSARQLGESIANALLGAIGQASDALADFALSGFRNVEDLKKAFSDLFADLAKQILKIIIQTLILKAIQGALGGSAAPIATAIGGAGTEIAVAQAQTRQSGGPAPRGRPLVVGERGPERFVPAVSGSIEPNSSLTPEVNVSIVNVKDPDEVTNAMNSAQGEQVILNVLARNKNKLKGMLV